MNNYRFLLPLFASLCFSAFSHAQTATVPVHFAKGDFITGNNVTSKNFAQSNLQSSLFGGQYFSLIQFAALPSLETRQQLKNAGVELGEYIPGNAYLAAIPSNFDFTSAANYKIVSINTLPAMYKIDAAALNIKNSVAKNDTKLIAVTCNAAVNKITAGDEIKKTGALIVPTKFDRPDIIFIKATSADIINTIAALPFVNYIGVQQMNATPVNYNDIALHGISSVQSYLGRNLRGKNVTIGVGDNADISTHMDFTGRLINRVFSVPSGHGTHTSGTAAGAGIINPMYQGMAPKSTIISQWFTDVITNTPVYVTDNNMIATNNSYTTADNACPGEGVYDVTSNYIDAQMKSYDEVLHIFAAGNDGIYTCSPYPAAFGTVKSGWQCAKNVLTVGNIDGATYTVFSTSSRGPVQDGRVKPEIVTSGTSITSTQLNNAYGTSSGTSMATPVVTGASALLNERYHQLHGSNPKAALIKALMCNTAEDLGNSGPDYTYGFGLLNVRRAVEAMEANRYIISSTPNTSFPVTIPAGVRRVKIMLYWADAPAAVGAAAALVNDLDLTVTDNPVTVTHLPLVLNATPANVNVVAAEGADHKNNIEQVVIDNPAPGNYLMNVNAFALPQGPQEYVLTYQFDMNGITVEYPFGGETLVPSQAEKIRWSAYGDESNTFTVEYSTNNGVAWTTVNNNVAATARSINWTVPIAVTNDYLVRVKRNSSVYTDQSDYNFSVIGQPVVTATIPCEGFVQLNWGAITGNTGYDVMQLKGDSMEVIATTSGTSYLVQGLNANTTYWFGVRANNGTVHGRRSVSVSALPATGVCTLSNFDNDFKAASIDAPVTGRQFTSSALGAAEIIKLTIKNLDNIASAGTYDLSYQVNGGAVITETVSAIVPSLGTYTHSFAATFDFSLTGIYTIKAWVKRPGDTQVLDDTISVTIKSLANAPVTLPVTDGFETTTNKEYTNTKIGLDGDDRLDFKTNSARGRGRTFVNTGFALNGSRAITLDQFPNGVLSTDSLLMTYNAATYNSGNQLRLEFNYKNHGQDNNPDNKVWIRGSDTSPWIYAYNLVSNQAALGQWKNGIINVNDVLDTVLPAQPITSSFQIKFGQQGNTSANVPNPLVDQDDGYTFDDVKFLEAFDDVAVQAVVSPVLSGCNATGVQPVSVTIKNYSGTTFNNVPVSYRINGGAIVADIIPVIAPNTSTAFTFAVPANLTVNTDYSFNFWVTAATDTYRGNDSILNYSFHTSAVMQVTSAQPYLEGFEINDGGWYTKGNNTSWQWGTPAKTIINKAPNGVKAWVTNLTGNYNDNEFSYLYSPCFDLSALTHPVLSFSHIFNVETDYDFTWVEYSADGGVTWNKLGISGTGTNWYDMAAPPRWRLSQNKWHVASTDIPVNSSNVRFRFVMASDGGLDMEGVGIDDIHIFEKANIYTGANITAGITQPVSGNNWIHFESGGKRIASVNPNGNNLGSTSAYVYFNPAVPVRFSSNKQYYLDRNIVLKVSAQPTGPDVGVRFYFTDAEAKALMNATGCALCTTISDPYVSGVTQYSETGNTNEDGDLANDVNGFFQFKLPANVDIIPYDTGYYAEFYVNSFSEFWINNGGLGANQPLPVSLLSFEASKQNGSVYLQWVTENEVNLASFIIERSSNGGSFSAIGTVTANNTNGTSHYNFTDAHPLEGNNYYRLRVIDRNNVFSYSPIRKVNFKTDGGDIVIYPNPVTNSILTITSSVNCSRAELFDAAGKQVRQFVLNGRNNVLGLTGVAKGIYQLKIVTEKAVYTNKIIVQ
ncbi:S8 family serine peptidase [Ferruginibacter sp. SUN106]|uniref:S8 family serine peptidase n=1 Tax=Ferruginibacter sp. SUN106 TaxID=2978348 RepID=UPI003D367A82